MPIYIVTNKEGRKRLIKSPSSHRAVSAVAKDELSCRLASTEEALRCMEQGAKLEDVTGQKREPDLAD